MKAMEHDIVAFLSEGASYGEPGAAVTRIETHCSITFLLRDRAYKLKRPIAFSALDYSTVERRYAACRAELELNRRTAPELYLGMHRICRRPDGTLGFDGEGEALDWVVAMRRFDQADLFSHIASIGRLDPGLLSRLADEVAEFHGKAESRVDFGGAARIRATIERNHADQMTVETVLSRLGIDSLCEASLDTLAKFERTLDRRRDAGRVRRCHGDLRLANICLIGDRPTLFDAIEFAHELACIDVLFDLAFLLADLLSRRMDFAAGFLLNRYLDGTGDDRDLAVLPLMMSIRMGTRAFTLAAAAQRCIDRSEIRRLEEEARSHLAIASSLLAERRPKLVALGGLQGSAKSALACALAAELAPAAGARILNSEVFRKKLLGLSPHARPCHTAYEPQVIKQVYAAMAAKARRLLGGGTTVIVDAGFYHASERHRIAAAASAVSAPFFGRWVGDSDLLDATASALEWHGILAGSGEEPMALATSIAAETT